MTRTRLSLKRLLERIKEMAAYWTAIGAMAIPLSIVLLIETKGFSSFWSWIALCLMLLGITSVILGWVRTLTEERQRRKEGIISLYVLTAIAEKLGVDLDKALEKMKGIVEKKL